MTATRFVNPDGVMEKMVVEDDRLHIVRAQEVDDHLRWVRHLRDVAPAAHGDAKFRLVGSVPSVIAEQWAAECGAAIGTREFAVYCKRKLMDGEFAAFRVRGT